MLHFARIMWAGWGKMRNLSEIGRALTVLSSAATA
jgi:hypothetical protein